ncbi:MAG: flagellar protein FlgN [Vallitaleaceae bacterium]|nr:flagellar protein FlgN [Vallitaleaceae bacterium]
MASLIEELFSILEDETGCYEQLLDMANNKKDVIIKGDVPSLQEITKIEQELAGHILRLEKKRKQNLDDMCLVLNKKPDELTITHLVDVLLGEEKQKLAQIHNKLAEVVTALQEHNEICKKLLQQSIEFIDFTVNAVQSMSSAPTGNVYESKGNRYADVQGRNFFDAKQ